MLNERIRRTLLAAVLLAACSHEQAQVVVPSLDGKSDVNLGAITQQGFLAYGEAATGEFTADLQFFGYSVLARAGARLDLEVTEIGSTADLDTTLFVYGPAVTAASDAIAFDNDSGSGQRAKIAGLVAPGDGEYLVVVGTADGRDRGEYRLELRCESSECAPPEAAFKCAVLEDDIRDCVSEEVNTARSLADEDAFWGEAQTRAAIDEAWDACTTDPLVGFVRETACERLAGPAPAWCTEPIEKFMTTEWPPCVHSIAKPTPSDFEWPD